MKRPLMIGCWVCFLAASASAATNLTSSTEPDMPLMMDAGTTAGPLLLSVSRDETDPPLEDNLSGWQLSLIVQQDPGTTGTLAFDEPMLPESGYIFDGLDTFGFDPAISTTNTDDDSLLVFDFSLDGGVEVPADPGAGLLVLRMLASSDADGLFGIYAVGDLTLWTDSAEPLAGDREFDNVTSTGLTRIADVQVRIPEPTSLVCALVALGLASIAAVRRRN